MLDFNLEELIVILIRIIGSLPVIFFPFIGSIFAIIIDLSDLFIINYIDLGGVQNYQNLDKFLDLFYMSAFLFVSLKWNSTEKIISIILFSYRIIGVVLFLLFDLRIILLIFPNIFEFWFVGISAYKFYSKSKAKYLIQKGSSINKIRSYLFNKGINDKYISETINNIKDDNDDQDFFSAIKICKKKRIGPARDENNRPLFYKKDLGILARSGFEFETSKRVLDIDKEDYLKIINFL